MENSREIKKADGEFLGRKWKVPFYELNIETCKYSEINSIFTKLAK